MTVEIVVPEPQYATEEQEHDASVLGMWVFLGTEVLLFGGVVTAFLATRVFYPTEFAEAAGRLNILIGGVNTVVLLTSSLTMALAVHSARPGDRARLVRYLALTATLGAAFLGLKFYEYYTDWRDGLLPMTDRFMAAGWTEPARDHVALFLLFYYILTGMHAVHLTVGIGLVGWLIWRATAGRIRPERSLAVHVVGLYWHFIDVVWVILLPLLYLSGSHRLSDVHF